MHLPPKNGGISGMPIVWPADRPRCRGIFCSVYLLLSVLCGSSLQGFPGWAQSLTHDLARSRQVSRTRFATRQLCKLHYIIVPKLLGSPTADLPLRIRANLCAAALPADLPRLRYKLASSSWTSATVEDTARILCIYQCPGINGCGSAGHTFSLCWKSSLRRLTDFPYVLGHLLRNGDGTGGQLDIRRVRMRLLEGILRIVWLLANLLSHCTAYGKEKEMRSPYERRVLGRSSPVS